MLDCFIILQHQRRKHIIAFNVSVNESEKCSKMYPEQRTSCFAEIRREKSHIFLMSLT